MRILKEGMPVMAVATCPHCNCEMEYSNKDIQKDYESTWNQITSITNRTLYIVCPCCGEHITVQKLLKN